MLHPVYILLYFTIEDVINMKLLPFRTYVKQKNTGPSSFSGPFGPGHLLSSSSSSSTVTILRPTPGLDDIVLLLYIALKPTLSLKPHHYHTRICQWGPTYKYENDDDNNNNNNTLIIKHIPKLPALTTERYNLKYR